MAICQRFAPRRQQPNKNEIRSQSRTLTYFTSSHVHKNNNQICTCIRVRHLEELRILVCETRSLRTSGWVCIERVFYHVRHDAKWTMTSRPHVEASVWINLNIFLWLIGIYPCQKVILVGNELWYIMNSQYTNFQHIKVILNQNLHSLIKYHLYIPSTYHVSIQLAYLSFANSISLAFGFVDGPFD